MQALWKRLETQLQLLAPEMKENLQSGASDELLQHVESWIPIKLPEEVKAFYRIHDGQIEDTLTVNGWSFFSLRRLCLVWLCEEEDFGLPGSEYNFYLASPSRERYPAYWHPYWLPFMGHLKGPKYCIDLAPGPNGRIGQILLHNDRYNEYPNLVETVPSIRVVAPSLEKFLEALVNDIEAGKFSFDTATRSLWSEDMFSKLSKDMLSYQEQMRARSSFPRSSDLSWEDLNREYSRCLQKEPYDFEDFFLFEERIVLEVYPKYSFPRWQPRSTLDENKLERER